MNEDVNTVSPTLGFIIKTIDFQGLSTLPVSQPKLIASRYKLNIWDVGGQKTIRSYWRNYFEKTDALIWVVDATDRVRVGECMNELKALLLEEVSCFATVPRSDVLANTICLASFRCKSISVSQQDRYPRLYGRERGETEARTRQNYHA